MTIQILDKKFTPYLSESQIQTQVRRVAAEMTRDLKDEKPILACVLKGALFFFADLLENIQFPHEITFCRVSSYYGTQSTGEIKYLREFRKILTGRTLVFIEDIVETGETMEYMRKKTFDLGAKDVKIAALFLKPGKFHKNFPVDYVGFSIPDDFIVGYGLDYKEEGRNLPDVYQLAPEMNSQKSLKSELRETLRRARASVQDPLRKSLAACRRVEAVPGWKDARNLLVYVNHRSETGTESLFQWDQKRVIVPRCLPDGELELLEIRSRSELKPGAYGILEPNPAVRQNPERYVRPEEIDFAVLPGVGFDLCGHRLGQGGGYYDRLLPRFRPKIPTVGLAFDCQVVPEIPVEPHDLGVKYIATETLTFATHPRSERRPQVWGILGGIACGKSAVSGFFRENGIPVFDADRYGHGLYENEEFRWALLDCFETCDRREIARIVFGSPEKLSFLNALFHPAIHAGWLDFYESARKEGAPVVILDAPLLLEAGWGTECDELLYVDLPRELQICFVKKRGCKKADLEAREKNQFPLEKKRAAATVIVPNPGNEELWENLRAVLRRLKDRNARK